MQKTPISNSKKLLPYQLLDLDAFDLAFLHEMGYIDFLSPFDASYALLKAAGRKKELWSPEVDLMTSFLSKAWKKHGGKLGKDIMAAFDLSGDISVNQKKIASAFKKHKKVGEKVFKEVDKKLDKILLAAQMRSFVYLLNKRPVEKEEEDVPKTSIPIGASGVLATAYTKADWGKYLRAVNKDHIRAFTEEFPERILHPEISRLTKIVETTPYMRTVDKVVLSDRIKRTMDVGERYFAGMSDVQVGRMWNFSGLELAYQQGVTEYQIIAQRDERTCTVCERIDGKTFRVQQAREKMLEHMTSLCGTGGARKAAEGSYCEYYEKEKTKMLRRTGKCRKPSRLPDSAEGKRTMDMFQGNFSSDSKLKESVEGKLQMRMLKLSGGDKDAYKSLCSFLEKEGVVMPGFSPERSLVGLWARTSADGNTIALLMQRAAVEEFGLDSAITSHFSKHAMALLDDVLKLPVGSDIMKGARVFLREMYHETQAYLKAQGIEKLTLFRGMGLAKGRTPASIKRIVEEQLVKAEKAEAEALKKLRVAVTESKNFELSVDINSPLIQHEKVAFLREEVNKLNTLYKEAQNYADDVRRGKIPLVLREEMQLQPLSSFSAEMRIASSFSSGGASDFKVVASVEIPAESVISTPASGYGCLSETEYVIFGGEGEGLFAVVPGNGSLNELSVRRVLEQAIKENL